ncbi:nuclear transport factor 2 family protein [Microbacterium tumbae]
MSGTDDLALRVQVLEDIQEIRALVYRYREHLDRRDLAAYASLFAADGQWSGRTGTARTPAGIQSMLEERLAPNPPAPGPTTRHFVTEPSIVVDGDTATGSCLWSLLGRGDGDVPEIVLLGHYEDSYVREDGVWKFASRIAHVDVPA